MAPIGPARRRALWLWACLAIGFSPTWLDLARHLAAEPWARYVLVFPLLFARIAPRQRSSAASRAEGVAWIALGALLQLVAVGGEEVRLGRVGLAPAMIGACRFLGIGRPANLLLWLGLVPVPSFVVTAGSPLLQALSLWYASALTGGAGVAAQLVAPHESAAAGALAIRRTDSGVPLAVLLVGLSWARSIALGRGAWAAAWRLAVAALLAFPLHVLALAAALLLGGVAGADTARVVLSNGPWLVAALAGVALVERALRAGVER